VVRITKTTQL